MASTPIVRVLLRALTPLTVRVSSVLIFVPIVVALIAVTTKKTGIMTDNTTKIEHLLLNNLLKKRTIFISN